MYCTVCSVDQTPEIILNTCYSSASTCHEYSGETCVLYMELTEVTSQLQGFLIGAHNYVNANVKNHKMYTCIGTHSNIHICISNSPLSISDLILVQPPRTSTAPHSGLFTGRPVEMHSIC